MAGQADEEHRTSQATLPTSFAKTILPSSELATLLLAVNTHVPVIPVTANFAGRKRWSRSSVLLGTAPAPPASQAELAAERPTVGDRVVIMPSENTQKHCPVLIGKTAEIVVDDESPQPYQVRSLSECWLYPDDVQKAAPDALQGVQKSMGGVFESVESMFLGRKGELTNLADPSDYHAKVDEAARENKSIVIVFHAQRCRACLATMPKVQRLIPKWPDVEFCDMIIDKNKRFVKEKNIKFQPHVELYLGEYGKVESFQCGPKKVDGGPDSLTQKLEYHTGCGEFPCADLTEEGVEN
jgi:hypothetical protein